MWAQIELYVFVNKIEFKISVQFKELHSKKIAKDKLYRLYQIKKLFQGFLNICLRLPKKAKIVDSQALYMPNKKLSDEVKNRPVTIKKAKNLNNLIIFMRDINGNVKVSKKSHLCPKLVTLLTSL